jgi:hypothetical protein
MRNNNSRTYRGINSSHADIMLRELYKEGMKIAGNNPWRVDTMQFGVKLDVTWSENSGDMSITIASREWFVPASRIWETIETSMRRINVFNDKAAS